MIKVYSFIDLTAPPDEVWKLIGGFGSFTDWYPHAPEMELFEGGRKRVFKNSDSSVTIERLLRFNESQHYYTYQIVKTALPVRDYTSTLQVITNSNDTGSRVEWSGQFIEVGVSPEEIHLFFREIYDSGLEAIREHFQRESESGTF